MQSGVQPNSEQTNHKPYLLNYDEVTNYNEDSHRLPSYQSRYLARYHPYMRFTPSSRARFEADAISMYMNTVYDDECVFLEVPPPITMSQTTIIGSDSPANVLATQINQPGPIIDAERALENGRRMYRVSAIIVEFLLAVKRAIFEAPAPGTAQAPVAVPPEN